MPNEEQLVNATSSRLPDEVRSELFSFETFQFQDDLLAKYSFDIGAMGDMDDTLQELLESGDLQSFPQKVREIFKTDQQKAQAFSIELVSKLLVKFDDRFEHIDIRAVVRKWGGVGAELAEDQVLDEQTFVQAYIAGLPGTINRRQAHRIQLAFLGLLKEEHDAKETKNQLMRSEKVGGMGLDAETAQRVVSQFQKEAKGKKFEHEVEEESVVETTEPAKPAEGAGVDHFSEEDAKEIEQIAKEKKEAIEHVPIASLEDVVVLVCKSKMFQFENPMLTQRCEKFIESRVRGVRDAFATRRQFELSVEQGGLGVKGRKLSEMTQALERAVVEYEDLSTASHEKGKALKKEIKQINEQTENVRQNTEKQLMDKRYASMTGRMPEESLAPVGPKSTRTSVAVAAHVETQQREGKIDVARVKEVIEASKQPTEAKRRPAQPKKVQDIKFEKRLAGPTEEISRLSLVDFRRLSSDPVQAKTKIKDKIDLLENQGYEMKVAGIKAWRSSPLNQMYIKLTEHAVLEGIPIQQALEEAQGGAEDALTDQELKVIMNLNAELRF